MRALRHFHHVGQVNRLLAALLAILLVSSGAHLPAAGRGTHAPSVSTRGDTLPESEARAVYDRLPLAFEVNQGQRDPSVRFVAYGRGYGLALTPTEALLSLSSPSPTASHDRAETDAPPVPPSSPTVNLHFRFPGGNPAPAMRAEQPLPGIVNSLIGNDPSRWRTNIPTAARVRYTDLYPGIDLTLYGTEGGGIEYDVIVAPGADPAAFSLSVGGATGMTLDAATGDLMLSTAAGAVRQQAPVLYQEVGGERRSVVGGYAMREDGTVGYSVGAYDPTLPLVIDPTLVYSTFLGGSGTEQGNGIAVDTSGNAYVTGFTVSTNFPITNGSTFGGTEDAFVTKLDANGARVYSTYLGGSDLDFGNGIAVDTHGNAYVTGYTLSTNFPVTNGSKINGTTSDAFVTALNGTGALVYSTYFGGSGSETGFGIAVDTFGNASISGLTASLDLPVTNGSTLGGRDDVFVAKLDGSGTRLYSTYLGGSGIEGSTGIAVDTNGNAYVTGNTDSTNFPVTNGSTLGGSRDAFVTKLDANGARVYSTYLGGSGIDEGRSIAVDTNGNAYVTGYTSSTDFPVTNGSTFGGGHDDAFVTKLNGSGTRLYSTYLGGSGDDASFGIAVDAAGNAYVTGNTNSTDFPVTNGSAVHNTFITKLNGTGARVSSTYLGGSGSGGDRGYAIAVDTNGNAYVTGYTSSTDFPVTNGSTYGGGGDAFVTKLNLVTLLAVSPATLPNGVVGTPYSQTITATGGTAPYSFAVSTGTLPPGLTLTTTGTLSGTPTAAGSFTFAVTATDRLGATGGHAYTLIIAGGAPPTANLQFYPLSQPVRLLDTRPGSTAFVHPDAPLTPGQTLPLPGIFSSNGVSLPPTPLARGGHPPCLPPPHRPGARRQRHRRQRLQRHPGGLRHHLPQRRAAAANQQPQLCPRHGAPQRLHRRPRQ